MFIEEGSREVMLVHVDFKPGFYRSRKCLVQVKMMAASMSVEQLS